MPLWVSGAHLYSFIISAWSPNAAQGRHADQTSAFRRRKTHLGQCVRHGHSNIGFYVGVARPSAGAK